MADYTQPPAVTRRVRFFDGQFLQDQDFIDEQKYHLDRERRIGKVLHITGIVEGLTVASRQANQVTVTAGTAIDRDGRQLVLPQDRVVDLPSATFNGKALVKVHIVYREQAADTATTGSKSERRWVEDPQVVAVTADGKSTEPWDDKLPIVVLAQLKVEASNGAVVVDATMAQQAGLRLPGSVGIGTGAAEPAAKLEVRGAIRFGDGTGSAQLVAGSTYYGLRDNGGNDRLSLLQSNGSVGIGTSAPAAKLDVTGPGDVAGQAALNLRSGNSAANYKSNQLTFGYNNSAQYRHALKTRHNGGDKPGNALDFYVWNQGTDGVDAIGTQHVMTLDGGGNVGIGTTTPRSALDTGRGVMTGAANDYQRAQFTMSGGGTVTWGGRGGRLKWTNRFIAISMERGSTFSAGYVDIVQPTAGIPATNVWDNTPRSADGDGVVLTEWEALYAVHTVGGNNTALSGFQIRRYTHEFTAPSNWILVALVNGDDYTVKLGTGVILSAKSSSSRGSPLPTGTILMWSGEANTIPDGWALCNGQQPDIPDLRSRFVMGAGGGDPAGTFGEPDQHSHVTYVGGVSGTTSTNGNHNHAPPGEWYDRTLSPGVSNYNSIDRGSPSVRSVRTSVDGNHYHSYNFDKGDVTSKASAGNRPKWFALCYIIKL
jgi:hypothetical protein